MVFVRLPIYYFVPSFLKSLLVLRSISVDFVKASPTPSEGGEPEAKHYRAFTL